jgi:hypothetical protein
LCADITKFVCTHEQYPLVGNADAQWTCHKCYQFLNMLAMLWSTWGQ